jgi:uncharacterized membrane protein YphA (DoxX/SURF4 family)
MNNSNARTIAYWVVTIFGPASFVIGGYLHLTRDPQVMATLAHLGYPAYFATIMGAWKLFGAMAIVVPGFPRVKEWAYAGFFFDLTGAAATRAFVGDGAAEIVAPLVFLGLVMTSRALAPARRKIPAETVNPAEVVFV